MRTHLLPGHEAGKVGGYAILVRARNVIPPCATYAAIFAHVSVAHVRMDVRTKVYQSRAFVITFFLLYFRAYARTYVRTYVLA